MRGCVAGFHREHDIEGDSWFSFVTSAGVGQNVGDKDWKHLTHYKCQKTLFCWDASVLRECLCVCASRIV